MTFLYSDALPENPTFAPTFEGEREKQAAGAELWDATRDLQIYRDNANAQANAMVEAYDRRNKAIFEASGIQLDNPYTAPDKPDYEHDDVADPRGAFDRRERQWRERATELARDRPELAGVVGLDRPIEGEAAAIARGAVDAYDRAASRADKAGLGAFARMKNVLGGGVAGMVRDPLQIAALFAGGEIAVPARTVFGRIVQRVFTEAAVNGGVEAGVQAASHDFKKKAGLDASVGTALAQVGLAAAFGGGFGGLLAGGSEVFRLLGRQAPEALARVGSGESRPGDAAEIAAALGHPLDDDTARAADIAAEQHAMDVESFGSPPAGVAPEEAQALAAQALREVDDPADVLPDPAEESFRQVDRIVRSEFPLGPEPRRPMTMMQFLATRAVGGIKDDAGELAAMDLTRKFIPGYGALVRGKGKSLDYAREAVAEAGFFDDIYGDPETAVAQSTIDDLLRALRAEAGGEPVYSPRNDGGRLFDWMEYQGRQRQQESYRRVVEDVSGALDELGLDHQLDDAVLIRASHLVDDETDAAAALERAIEEDYRNYADSLDEIGEGLAHEPEFDAPFFEAPADAGTGPRAGDDARPPGGDGAVGGRGADAPDRQQLQGAGEGEGAQPPLRQAGDTPEPASDQAVAEAGAILDEARGPDTEKTDAGEQTLLGGVKPVSTKEKLEAKGAKPLKGGDKPPPAGGLFDLDSQKQIDMWDAMPAVKQADGTILHATYDSMVEDAERTGYLSDVVRFCQD